MVGGRPPDMSAHDQDRECLDRVRAGDPNALEELYDRHADFLYSLIRRIVGHATEADEVLQETWVQAWRRAASHDPARGTVLAWLVTIARSRAIDRIRSEGSRQRAELAAVLEPSQAPADPSAEAARNQLRERVSSVLEQLGPRHRDVVELAYFSGLSQSEIATKLGAPLGTVKSWTRQALLRLGELLPREVIS